MVENFCRVTAFDDVITKDTGMLHNFDTFEPLNYQYLSIFVIKHIIKFNFEKQKFRLPRTTEFVTSKATDAKNTDLNNFQSFRFVIFKYPNEAIGKKLNLDLKRKQIGNI